MNSLVDDYCRFFVDSGRPAVRRLFPSQLRHRELEPVGRAVDGQLHRHSGRNNLLRLTRAQLVADSFVLAHAGVLPYDIPVAYLKDNDKKIKYIHNRAIQHLRIVMDMSGNVELSEHFRLLIVKDLEESNYKI